MALTMAKMKLEPPSTLMVRLLEKLRKWVIRTESRATRKGMALLRRHRIHRILTCVEPRSEFCEGEHTSVLKKIQPGII
jgi:hypothetical protein